VQPFEKSPACYGSRRFITTFTRALHLSLSCARLIQLVPPTILICPRSILILSTLFCLGFRMDFFSTNNLYVFLFYPFCATSSSSTWSFWLHLVKGTSHKAHYAVFSILLSLHPSSVQIFSLVACSQAPSVLCYSLDVRPSFTPMQHMKNKIICQTIFLVRITGFLGFVHCPLF
jgi:hypothetical protein